MHDHRTLRYAAICCSVRGVIARRMHSLYLAKHAYFRQFGSQSGSASKPAPDNPDQRMTSDLTLFAQSLRQVLSEFGTAPFKIVFYSWWMWSYTGWLAVGVVYIFATVGAALQRSARLPTRP